MTNNNYKIYRFYFKDGKTKKLIKTGLTLEEAKEHCNSDDSRRTGIWFDGFTNQK